MQTRENPFNERVVKLVEMCNGEVIRTFYCIHDRDFGHWMSQEPFDGEIWTKDPTCRREFDSRTEAEDELDDFLQWREDQETGSTTVTDIPRERKAA